MKYLAAYALVSLSGRTPSEEDVKAVLHAAHVNVDAARLSALFAELSGKDFADVCNAGRAKLVGSGSAGGAATHGGAGAAASGGAGAAPAAAAASEAKKDEPEEEEDDDMGFGLFD